MIFIAFASLPTAFVLPAASPLASRRAAVCAVAEKKIIDKTTVDAVSAIIRFFVSRAFF